MRISWMNKRRKTLEDHCHFDFCFSCRGARVRGRRSELHPDLGINAFDRPGAGGICFWAAVVTVAPTNFSSSAMKAVCDGFGIASTRIKLITKVLYAWENISRLIGPCTSHQLSSHHRIQGFQRKLSCAKVE
ncbi:hypothetical protein MPTK1_8g11180 [Marchantia polymorpha subsp. ruderalis]|uniref:Uncharacterized protein n=1 Tax=Marchantia polymorpha TaxID=3197 RepID=A0A2R6XMK4_MARPO|nr:hypothetical protein MARPO_0008s0103 [Marchantia polymorpha]BBN19497.1 hypothetical protein Mp_8g11180 [Marchantia polymorpha subsp. ruderalis]|eukprot:PTQ47332.1 hypothetical protein MARPO_0008s0103 [Marchantia polymorpha]